MSTRETPTPAAAPPEKVITPAELIAQAKEAAGQISTPDKFAPSLQPNKPLTLREAVTLSPQAAQAIGVSPVVGFGFQPSVQARDVAGTKLAGLISSGLEPVVTAGISDKNRKETQKMDLMASAQKFVNLASFSYLSPSTSAAAPAVVSAEGSAMLLGATVLGSAVQGAVINKVLSGVIKESATTSVDETIVSAVKTEKKKGMTIFTGKGRARGEATSQLPGEKFFKWGTDKKEFRSEIEFEGATKTAKTPVPDVKIQVSGTKSKIITYSPSDKAFHSGTEIKVTPKQEVINAGFRTTKKGGFFEGIKQFFSGTQGASKTMGKGEFDVGAAISKGLKTGDTSMITTAGHTGNVRYGAVTFQTGAENIELGKMLGRAGSGTGISTLSSSGSQLVQVAKVGSFVDKALPGIASSIAQTVSAPTIMVASNIPVAVTTGLALSDTRVASVSPPSSATATTVQIPAPAKTFEYKPPSLAQTKPMSNAWFESHKSSWEKTFGSGSKYNPFKNNGKGDKGIDLGDKSGGINIPNPNDQISDDNRVLIPDSSRDRGHRRTWKSDQSQKSDTDLKKDEDSFDIGDEPHPPIPEFKYESDSRFSHKPDFPTPPSPFKIEIPSPGSGSSTLPGLGGGIRIPRLGGGGLSSPLSFISQKGKTKSRYSPSLLANVLNIKGVMPKKLTGIEVRPIILGRRKKK